MKFLFFFVVILVVRFHRVCVDFTFSTEVSKNNEVTVSKDDHIDSERECHGPPCAHSGICLECSDL